MILCLYSDYGLGGDEDEPTSTKTWSCGYYNRDKGVIEYKLQLQID